MKLSWGVGVTENSILDLTAFYLLVCHGVDFFKSGKEDAIGRGMKDGEKKGVLLDVKCTDFGYAKLSKRKV